MKDAVEKVIDKIIRASSSKRNGFGIMSKLDAIDSITNGFKPGLVYVVAAEAGAYKTALCLTVLEKIGIESEASVAYFNKFSTVDVLATRMIFQFADVDYVHYIENNIEDHDILALKRAGDAIAISKIKMLCSENVSLDDIYDTCVEADRPDIVIVDSLNDVSLERGLEFTLQFLKSTAIECEIPIIVTYEVPLKNINKIALLENGADTILYLDNEVWEDVFGTDYFGDPIMLSYIELHVVRNFCGPTRKARLFVKKNSLKFYNYDISI